MGSDKVIWRNVAERLVQKANEDPAFRKKLLADSKATISGELHVQFQEDLEIHVLEENDKNVYLVLPSRGPTTGELTESELASVAGGFAVVSSGQVLVPPGKTVLPYSDGGLGPLGGGRPTPPPPPPGGHVR